MRSLTSSPFSHRGPIHARDFDPSLRIRRGTEAGRAAANAACNEASKEIMIRQTGEKTLCTGFKNMWFVVPCPKKAGHSGLIGSWIQKHGLYQYCSGVFCHSRMFLSGIQIFLKFRKYKIRHSGLKRTGMAEKMPINKKSCCSIRIWEIWC